MCVFVRVCVYVHVCVRVRTWGARAQSSTKCVHMGISFRGPNFGTTQTTLIDNICLLEKINSKRQTYGS